MKKFESALDPIMIKQPKDLLDDDTKNELANMSVGYVKGQLR